MKTFYFDTIDGEVKAVERFDSKENIYFFDCYLTDSDGEERFIGEAYSSDKDELEKEINYDLL